MKLQFVTLPTPRGAAQKSYGELVAMPPDKRGFYAQSQVRRVLRLVDLRPSLCPACKRKRRMVAHHENYFHPLRVAWLCFSCHSRLHRRLSPVNVSDSIPACI